MPLESIDEPTQLLLLASLLEPATYSSAELRSALQSAKGDLSLAAEELLLPKLKSAGKRKAGTSLESWFGKKRGEGVHVASEPIVVPPSPPSKIIQGQAGPSVPVRDAFALLKSSASSTSTTKAKATPQSALHLTSQEAIDKHRLPLSLLTSPLSPAFASALYLAMMEESESWERHKWYLAGKWVESPHTMSGYHQVGGGFGVDRWSGCADSSTEGEMNPQYFYSGKELPYPKVCFRIFCS